MSAAALREALERFEQMTVSELSATLSLSGEQVRRLLDTDEVKAFARDTGQRFRSSIVVEFVRPRAPARPRVELTDDDILRMWEMHQDEHRTMTAIAETFGITLGRVRHELEELGVLEPRPDRDAGVDPRDPLAGLSPEDALRYEKIMAAMARIGGATDEPLTVYARHLPFARSLPHVKPGVRKRITQSEHQRRMERMGSGPWATIIRRDLRHAGLLP